MESSQFLIFCVIFYLHLFISQTICEVFTSMANIEELLPTEKHLIAALENYVKAEQNRLELLEGYAKLYREHLQRASKDVESYISNPVNAYILVKNLTSDWQQVESLISTDTAKDYMTNITYIKETMKYPTAQDLNGARAALIRLQNTYKLDISSLSRAELNAGLTSSDCFEFGRKFFEREDYHLAVLWFEEADSKLDIKSSDATHRSDILEYLAFSIYKQGNITLALETTNTLLQLNPDHQKALQNKEYFEYVLQKGDHSETTEVPYEQRQTEPYDSRTYEALCRGDLSPSIDITSKLKCLYVNHGNRFLFLAPFKVEEAYLNPNIYIYHDVISDGEIETIKRLATPELKRAGVRVSEDGKGEIADYRICKLAWLKEEDDKHIADISQRVADMTKLSLESAEKLQVVNYGIGGQYEPHFDFVGNVEEEAFKEFGSGDRIATVLFYMSDVAQGGATVFPNVLASVWPKKGTAAFWYNLHESGNGDVNTFHAACPVLSGSEWVCNKWLHEKFQEFLRPCPLVRPSYDLTKLIKDYDIQD